MPKTYQVVTERGLVIPQALCTSAQLGQEVVVDVEPGRIAIRPARVSSQEAQRRALRYVLMNLGDALEIGVPELRDCEDDAFWQVVVKRKNSGVPPTSPFSSIPSERVSCGVRP